MKAIILLALLALTAAYDRNAVYNYAATYWSYPNHDCNSAYTDCTPYSYWGGDNCSYGSNGGDCANFVSQCVLAGGHSALVGGACRGYPCGVEEVGARNLGWCLYETFGWERVCGYNQSPPSSITTGDVLVYHRGSCDSYDAHAVIVVGNGPNIACHSANQWDIHYSYFGEAYLEWLHYPSNDEPMLPEPVTEENEEVPQEITLGAALSATELSAFRTAALNAHNTYRARHGVSKLTLNSSLNTMAQNYANTMASTDTFAHSPSSSRKLNGQAVGENLYGCRGMAVTGDSATKSWYDEISQYNYNDPGFKSGTGHFTQVVWKSTTSVGFGVSQSSSGWYYVVANYFPAGNYLNQFEQNVLPLV